MALSNSLFGSRRKNCFVQKHKTIALDHWNKPNFHNGYNYHRSTGSPSTVIHGHAFVSINFRGFIEFQWNTKLKSNQFLNPLKSHDFDDISLFSVQNFFCYLEQFRDI